MLKRVAMTITTKRNDVPAIPFSAAMIGPFARMGLLCAKLIRTWLGEVLA
jgi:hypothetical protein